MTKQETKLEQTLRKALQTDIETMIPSKSDLWLRIRRDVLVASDHGVRRKRTERTRFLWKATQVALYTGSVLGIGIIARTVVPAEVPRISMYAAGTSAVPVSIGVAQEYTQGHFVTTGDFILNPPPSFPIATLHDVPSGLTKEQFNYIPAVKQGKSAQYVVNVSEQGDALPDQDILHGLAAQGVDTVWLHFSATSLVTASLDIVEQAMAPGAFLPSGESISLEGDPARIQVVRDKTIITLFHAQTSVVTITTNMGANVGMNAVASLVWH